MGLFLAGFAAIITVDILTLTLKKKLSFWVRLFIHGIAVTALVSFIVISFHNISGWQAISLTFLQTAVISVIAISMREILSEQKLQHQPEAGDNVQPQSPRLIERLPLHLRSAKIHALKSEDHYVRVFTSSGEHLVLIRLKDAIAEMEPVIGVTTHRSWWVAQKGVGKINKSGRSTTITLTSGQEALVSRSGSKLIKDAGWS
ncbi:MAG: LytTR family DNA-binding domain-containing protein [Hellea sp.]